ncbi:YfgM family protein [Paraphotobacterium marinum]|uniref:YfgM family protein n=1 Tax=Paraphotobacterium marinum TaxID=1755811 RepID=UPI0039EB5CCD
MEVYTTEDQQVDAIKRWCKKYLKWVVVILVIIFAAILVKTFYHQSVSKDNLISVDNFEVIHKKLQSDEVSNGVIKNAKNYIENNKNEYSSLLNLNLSKVYVERQNYNEAINSLNWIIHNSSDVNLLNIAKVRLARLYIFNSQFDLAKNIIGTIKSESWKLQKTILMGDLYTKENKFDLAKKEYLKAKKINPNVPLINIKISNLNK